MIHLIFSQMYDAWAITKYNNIILLSTEIIIQPLNQIATFTAFVPVIYSISVVDKTIVNCNVASQLMAQLFSMCCLFGLNILIQIQKVFYWILKCVMV